MRYHNITTDDMNNGDGLRVVLWLAGCSHHCKSCQNPLTWDPNGGLPFDEKAKEELFEELDKPYISGITFSGGDPLHPENRWGVRDLICDYYSLHPQAQVAEPCKKTVWLYTGYTWEQIMKDKELFEVVSYADVLVDGKFEEDKKDVNYPWAGSTNQRVIDIQKTMKEGRVVLWKSK
jgi:anaerobic ribonucleoside-triphosphate reductase activating protein